MEKEKKEMLNSFSSRRDGQLNSGRVVKQRSLSEPDLNTARSYRYWPGFPPGFTVDQLHWFRKKRPPGISDWEPRDNLKPEEGSMKSYKSEYNRRFKNFQFLPASSENLTATNSQDIYVPVERGRKPTDILKLEGEFKFDPEYKELYIPHMLKQRTELMKPKSQMEWDKEAVNMKSEQHDKYVPFEHFVRPDLVKRSTSIHHEGEFTVKSSEMHSKYIEHGADAKRPDLFRRPTSLHMEGDMNVVTETAEKFIEYLIEHRPDLAKSKTSSTLQLEGDMDTRTEMSEKYVPFELPPKVPLRKRTTNLRLEGLMDTRTEIQDKFIPFNVERQTTYSRRDANLHLDGKMKMNTEARDKFVPFNVAARPTLTKRNTNLQLEGIFHDLTEKKEKFIPFEHPNRQQLIKKPTNLRLEGDIQKKTEQSEKYIPFEPQKRVPLIKKDTNLKLEGDLIFHPEQKSSENLNPAPVLLNDSKEMERKERIQLAPLTQYQKPYRNLPPALQFETVISKKPMESLKLEGPRHLQTENQTKYTKHEVDSKQKSKKQADNLQLMGELEARPEYKNKYVSFPRERPKVNRPVDELNNINTEQDYVKQKKRTRKYVQPVDNLRFEGRMDTDPEYKSCYVDFPRGRPVVRKPLSSLKPEGNVCHISEKEAKYIEYGPVPRSELFKRNDQFHLSKNEQDDEEIEGRYECQPEYRKAYMDFIKRENMSRMQRPFDANLQEDIADTKLMSSSSSGCRSISPDKRRKIRHVPRTPRQEKVLVPDLAGLSPRRPSSIFGPRTICSGCCSRSHFSDDESDLKRSCCTIKSRWHSPCKDYSHSRTVGRLPSPTQEQRRIWSKEFQTRYSEEKPASFVVLTDRVEINNNDSSRHFDKCDNDKNSCKCCKDKKCKPSWYEPPM